MASSKQVMVMAVVAAVACLAPLASAMMHPIGWRAKFNQTNWADDKTFVVGDSLLFLYDNEYHTVAQVDQDDFAACNLQGTFLAGPFNTGNDVVTLDKPGMMWFICTVPNHCNGGMKLAINVEVAPGPARLPWWGAPAIPALPGAPMTRPGPGSVSPVAAPPPSAAMTNPVGGAVAAAGAAVVAAALALF